MSAEAESKASANLIHVNTDVLDVVIDLKGGNIISATMPNYKKAEKSKETI